MWGAVFDEFTGKDVDGAAVFDGILAGKDFSPAPGDNHICGGGDAVTLTGNGGDAAVNFNIALAGFEGGGFEAVIPAGDVEGAVVELHGFGAANAVIHGVNGDGAAVYINVILAVDAVIDVAIDGERAGAFDVHVVLGKDGPAGTGIIKGVGHVRRAGDDGVFGALRHAEAQLFRLLHVDGRPREAGDAGRVQINGRPAKASTDVKVGDKLTIQFGNKDVNVEVLDVQETVHKEDVSNLFRYI